MPDKVADRARLERAREFSAHWRTTEDAFRRPGELLAAWEERKWAAFAASEVADAVERCCKAAQNAIHNHENVVDAIRKEKP